MQKLANRIKNVNRIVPVYTKSNMVDKSTNTEIIYSDIEMQRYIMCDIANSCDILQICRKYGKPPEYIAYVLLKNKYQINRIHEFTGLDSEHILRAYLKY